MWRFLPGLMLCVAFGCQPPVVRDNQRPPATEVGDDDDDTGTVIDTDIPDGPRIVVLMVGDGMGSAQLDAASGYLHGATEALAVYDLPHRGRLRTGGPSGITDSAAAATAMATGVYTHNRKIALDRDGQDRKTLVELAREVGLSTGVVSTASLAHATPASFTAHVEDRGSYEEIAQQQLSFPPDLMFGGGADYFGGDTAPGMEIHAGDHMDYELDRTNQPSLTEMSITALDRLEDENANGFFLVIEGARIDMAGHGNDLPNVVGDTLAFDAAVTAVSEWLDSRDGTLIVTADHETGGLTIDSAPEIGVLPDVSWRWGLHTNVDVDVFGSGPGTEVIDGQLIGHPTVHAALRGRIIDEPFIAPEPVLLPDGNLAELSLVASTQTQVTDFGEGYNQLDAMLVGGDSHGLNIGFEGTFEFDANAVVVLVDTDYGGPEGHASMLGAIQDSDGDIDAILAGLRLTAPADAAFAADFAVVAYGGEEVWLDALAARGGLRGLSDPTNLPWLASVVNYGVGSRDAGSSPVPGLGLEISIPWTSVYDGTPQAATIALAAVLVNDDGSYTSNQALPPFPDANGAGPNPVALPGVVVMTVADGVPTLVVQ